MPSTTFYSILHKKENAHDDPIYCCCWVKTHASESREPTKDVIVTGGLDSLVKVWYLENNKLELLNTLKGHTMAVESLAVSPDGHTLASISLDSSFCIWDLMPGTKVHDIETEATGVWKAVFSPDGTSIAVGSHSGKVFVYSVETGMVQYVLDTRGKFILCLAWLADSECILTGAVDGKVCVFNVPERKLMHTLEAHTKSVRSVAFSPHCRQFVTASDDGSVKIFDIFKTSQPLHTLQHETWVLNACYSPDGSRVGIATADGAVTIALANGLKVLNTFQEHTDMVCDLEFNKNSDKLVSVSKDKSINIYECPVPKK